MKYLLDEQNDECVDACKSLNSLYTGGNMIIDTIRPVPIRKWKKDFYFVIIMVLFSALSTVYISGYSMAEEESPDLPDGNILHYVTALRQVYVSCQFQHALVYHLQRGQR